MWNSVSIFCRNFNEPAKKQSIPIPQPLLHSIDSFSKIIIPLLPFLRFYQWCVRESQDTENKIYRHTFDHSISQYALSAAPHHLWQGQAESGAGCSWLPDSPAVPIWQCPIITRQQQWQTCALVSWGTWGCAHVHSGTQGYAWDCELVW